MILKKLCELHWWGSEIQRFGLIYHTTYYDSEDTYHTGLFSKQNSESTKVLFSITPTQVIMLHLLTKQLEEEADMMKR